MQAVPVRLVDVPLAAVRCDAKAVHVREGWGGQPIGTFPIAQYFARHVAGADVRDELARWMALQWARYGLVPKALGGMRAGSFERLLGQLGGDVEAAARRRADQRLELLESIRVAYEPRDPPPYGAWIGDGFSLVGGHHRAAALWALGKETIPCETL